MPIRRVTMTDDPGNLSTVDKSKSTKPKKAKKSKAKSAKPKLPGRSPVAKDAECDFNQLIVRAADCVHELRRLSQSPKLSTSAFTRDALALSGKSEEQFKTYVPQEKKEREDGDAAKGAPRVRKG